MRGHKTLGLEYHPGLSHRLCLLQESVTQELYSNNMYIKISLDMQRATWNYLRKNDQLLPAMTPSVKSKGCTRYWSEWQNGSDWFVNRSRCFGIMKDKFSNTQGFQLYANNREDCDNIYVHWLCAMEKLTEIIRASEDSFRSTADKDIYDVFRFVTELKDDTLPRKIYPQLWSDTKPALKRINPKLSETPWRIHERNSWQRKHDRKKKLSPEQIDQKLGLDDNDLKANISETYKARKRRQFLEVRDILYGSARISKLKKVPIKKECRRVKSLFKKNAIQFLLDCSELSWQALFLSFAARDKVEYWSSMKSTKCFNYGDEEDPQSM